MIFKGCAYLTFFLSIFIVRADVYAQIGDVATQQSGGFYHEITGLGDLYGTSLVQVGFESGPSSTKVYRGYYVFPRHLFSVVPNGAHISNVKLVLDRDISTINDELRVELFAVENNDVKHRSHAEIFQDLGSGTSFGAVRFLEGNGSNENSFLGQSAATVLQAYFDDLQSVEQDFAIGIRLREEGVQEILAKLYQAAFLFIEYTTGSENPIVSYPVGSESGSATSLYPEIQLILN